MRYVCPNCGNIDRSQWMQNRWRSNVYFIKVEYTEDIPSNVLQAYGDGRSHFQDENYGYRLCQRQGIIERILIEEVEAFGFKSAFHQPREPVDHSILGMIPKLSEYATKDVILEVSEEEVKEQYDSMAVDVSKITNKDGSK